MRAILALVVLAVAAMPQASAATTTVDIQNFTFQPPVIVIAPGDTVTWVNHDGIPHTASDILGSFDTGDLFEGEAASVTFDAPGAYAYFCKHHIFMWGVVVVN